MKLPFLGWMASFERLISETGNLKVEFGVNASFI